MVKDTMLGHLLFCRVLKSPRIATRTVSIACLTVAVRAVDALQGL